MPDSSSNTTQTARDYVREQGYGHFFNADFKVTRTQTLTLNLGMRYELEKLAYDKCDRMTSFIPGHSSLGINRVITSSDQYLPQYKQQVADLKRWKITAAWPSQGLWLSPFRW